MLQSAKEAKGLIYVAGCFGGYDKIYNMNSMCRLCMSDNTNMF